MFSRIALGTLGLLMLASTAAAQRAADLVGTWRMTEMRVNGEDILDYTRKQLEQLLESTPKDSPEHAELLREIESQLAITQAQLDQMLRSFTMTFTAAGTWSGSITLSDEEGEDQGGGTWATEGDGTIIVFTETDTQETNRMQILSAAAGFIELLLLDTESDDEERFTLILQRQ